MFFKVNCLRLNKLLIEIITIIDSNDLFTLINESLQSSCADSNLLMQIKLELISAKLWCLLGRVTYLLQIIAHLY